MRTQSRQYGRIVLVGLLVTAVAVAGIALVTGPTQAGASGKGNPGILPPQSNPHGGSYADWAAAWWTWAVSIPAAENPILDGTGEFAGVGQEGAVWFLAGTFGGEAERAITVPTGKALFIPLFNALWWAPDDLDDAAWLAYDILGYPAVLTDEELIRLIANFQVDFVTEMSVEVDGVPVKNPGLYRAGSDPFPLVDTDLLDDFGLETASPTSPSRRATGSCLPHCLPGNTPSTSRWPRTIPSSGRWP